MLFKPRELRDPGRALESVRRVARSPGIEHVLVGDGWCAFRNGGALLDELVAAATPPGPGDLARTSAAGERP